MKKKMIMILTMVGLLLSFCACENGTSAGNLDNSENSEEKAEVGTRDNPYQVGDTIELSNITPYIIGSYDENLAFDLTFTVNKSYSTDEGISIRESKYDTFTTIPAANVTFELTGNFDDAMELSCIFEIAVVDENMKTDSFISIEDDNLKSYSTIYTDAEYTGNILKSFDMETYTATETKFYVLKYRDSEQEEHSIYIAPESDTEEQAIEETEDTAEAGNTSYENALIAEEKGYYTIAMNLFAKTLDYEDSQEHYDNMKSILSEYNGTYYGDSTQYENVKVYLYIVDGIVTAQFEGMDKSLDEYELYLWGETENSEPILAFAYARTDLFDSLDGDASYENDFGFAIQQLDDGSYLVCAIEGSEYYTWNGFYEKISDTVE